MNNNPLISVIVPVYNTAQFLVECIESVIRQNYKNWELLLMDDGSSDESPKICDKYASCYERIKVIHKLNTGVSDTRNRALDIVKGEYVIFLDSDDFWSNENILQDLFFVSVEKQLDLCCADFKEVDVNGKAIFYDRNRFHNDVISDVIDSCTFLQDILKGEFFLWRCLIRKAVVDKLRFNTHRIFLEDAEFYLRMLQQPLRCMYLPKIFYSYRKHEDSVTVKNVPGNKKLRDAFDFTRLCFSLSKETSDNEMKSYLIKEGLENYIFDISVIGESKQTYKNRKSWFVQWNVADLDKEVKQVIKDNNLKSKYTIALFPLEFQLRYFRYKLYTKLYIKKIINQIINK